MSVSNDLVALPISMPIAGEIESQKNQPSSLLANMMEKTNAFAKGTLSFGKDVMKGTLIHSFGYLALFTGGENLKALYRVCFDPSTLQIKTPSLFQRIYLNEIIPKQIEFYKSNGLQVNESLISIDKILENECPKKEFARQIYTATNQQQPSDLFIKLHTLGILVVIPSISEELLFRGVMQDLVLKRLVGKIVSKIAPTYAGLVDSKIYTACRILLTSVAFSAIHNANRALMPDAYVDIQLVGTLILGVALGILKETVGMGAAIGAHAIQNLTAVAPALANDCNF